jgi:hypothetical protein
MNVEAKTEITKLNWIFFSGLLTLIDGIAYIGDYEGCSELPL